MHLGSQFGRKTYRQRCRPLARCPIAHRAFYRRDQARKHRPRNCQAKLRASTDRARFPPPIWPPGCFRGMRSRCESGASGRTFEQFGEVFQPLLGKIAPARKDIAAASHVESLCHEAARKEKNGRRRNRTESIERDRDILWKTFPMSSERARPDRIARQNTGKIRVVLLMHVKPRAAWRLCDAQIAA